MFGTHFTPVRYRGMSQTWAKGIDGERFFLLWYSGNKAIALSKSPQPWGGKA